MEIGTDGDWEGLEAFDDAYDWALKTVGRITDHRRYADVYRVWSERNERSQAKDDRAWAMKQVLSHLIAEPEMRTTLR